MQILVEDRKTTHTERINNSRHIVTMHPGDITMPRTVVQGDQSKDKVAKLCYQIRGSFHIIKCTGRGSYIVRKLNKPDSPELKFISEDL